MTAWQSLRYEPGTQKLLAKFFSWQRGKWRKNFLPSSYRWLRRIDSLWQHQEENGISQGPPEKQEQQEPDRDVRRILFWELFHTVMGPELQWGKWCDLVRIQGLEKWGELLADSHAEAPGLRTEGQRHVVLAAPWTKRLDVQGQKIDVPHQEEKICSLSGFWLYLSW